MNVARSCGTSCLSANPCQRSLALADLAGEAEVSKAQPGWGTVPRGCARFREFQLSQLHSEAQGLRSHRARGHRSVLGEGTLAGGAAPARAAGEPRLRRTRLSLGRTGRPAGPLTPQRRPAAGSGGSSRRRSCLSGHCGKARCGRGLTCCGAGRAGRRPAASRAGPGPAPSLSPPPHHGKGDGDGRQPPAGPVAEPPSTGWRQRGPVAGLLAGAGPRASSQRQRLRCRGEPSPRRGGLQERRPPRAARCRRAGRGQRCAGRAESCQERHGAWGWFGEIILGE